VLAFFCASTSICTIWSGLFPAAIENVAGKALAAVTGNGLSTSAVPQVPSACCCRTVRRMESKSDGVAKSVAMMSSSPPACRTFPEHATTTASAARNVAAAARPTARNPRGGAEGRRTDPNSMPETERDGFATSRAIPVCRSRLKTHFRCDLPSRTVSRGGAHRAELGLPSGADGQECTSNGR
jgi:hypothetical protein